MLVRFCVYLEGASAKCNCSCARAIAMREKTNPVLLKFFYTDSLLYKIYIHIGCLEVV